MRFELTTSTLARLRSTPELHPHDRQNISKLLQIKGAIIAGKKSQLQAGNAVTRRRQSRPNVISQESALFLISRIQSIQFPDKGRPGSGCRAYLFRTCKGIGKGFVGDGLNRLTRGLSQDLHLTSPL